MRGTAEGAAAMKITGVTAADKYLASKVVVNT